MMTIGIAGTAKNTGKTTTMSAMIAELRKSHPQLRLALTSIGYDGEYLDNITGLPKPRVEMREGDLAAVAKGCLKYSRAKLDILEDSGLMSAMGPILIGRVKKAGKLVIAGPNKKVEVRQILDRLSDLGSSLTIVDGALGRIVPMCEVDSLILSTGASRHADIERLAEETKYIDGILSLPKFDQPEAEVPAVLGNEDYDRLTAALAANDSVLVHGLVGFTCLERLAHEANAFVDKTLVMDSPMALLPIGEILETGRLLGGLREQGLKLATARPVRLIAVTVNPYYPKYRYNRQDYEPEYVDKAALLEAISHVTSAPVFDVVGQGAESLLELLR